MISISSSAIIPIAYLLLVLGGLTVFSTIYRRRKAKQSQSLQPWYPTHHPRDIYLTLLHLDPSPPNNLLKAALFDRAKEDISRVYQLREQKNAANQLLQKGSIAETTFQQILAAEQELNAEIMDVMNEARALGGEEWGQSIMAHANEYHQKTTILKTLEKSSSMAKKEREIWEAELAFRKEEAERQRELAIKELTEDGVKVDMPVEGEIPSGVGTPSKSKKKKNK